VRANLSSVTARTPDRQYGTSILECVRHGDEVVLSTDATHHSAVLQRIRCHGARERDDETRVDEARVNTLQSLEVFAAIELIHIVDARHANLIALGRGHSAHRFVEAQGPEKKTA